MKLRNKKTRQVGNFIINKDHFECVDPDFVLKYNSLADLTAEWEDYEEPKEYYFLDPKLGVIKSSDDDCWLDRQRKTAGNYFETKEEAERAVEKLKAWKRLRDGGFKFVCGKNGGFWDYEHILDTKDTSGIIIFASIDDGESTNDLDLLFGGEDE